MADNISFVESDNIKESIQIILRQTNYTENEANNKLKERNYDYMSVIKDYLGITEKKALHVKSVNQEIYKQMRYKLNSDMTDYIKRKNNNETKLK